MRIGIDARLWNQTGVGRYIRNLVRGLAKLDKKNEYVIFVLPKDYKTIVLTAKNFNKKIAPFRWHSLTEQIQFPTLLKKEKLDLMHFLYFSVPLFYRGKFVVTIHDLIINSFDTGKASTLPVVLYKLKRLMYSFVVKYAIKKSEKIITVSDTTKREILNKYTIASDKVIVTHEGVDPQITKEASQKITLPKKYILYVGNSYPHKNVDTLLRAFSSLYSSYQNINLVLVGKEDFFYKRVKARVKNLNIEKPVIFTGKIPDAYLSQLYKNAVALVIPSFMEGFSLPILEAFANKCVVIASNIPVHREVGRSAIIYFDPKDVKDLEQKLQYVLSASKEEIQKYKVEGKFLLKFYSWDSLVEKTLSTYLSLQRV